MTRYIFSVLFIISFVNVFGQDPKFSQFFASPITHNPANIGYFDGQYRISSNSRRQWSNVVNPYNVISISGEYKFNDEYYYDDIFSIGLNGVFENNYNGIIKTNTANVGFSYYRFFDSDHQIRFGLAPLISLINKSIDYSKLSFASQYQNGNFNLSLPNHLESDNSNMFYLDLSIGANLALSMDNYNLYLGYSAFHLTRPNESYIKNYRADLAIRHTISAGFQYFTHDLLDINFNIYRMSQGSSHDEVIGTVLGFKPNLESKSKFDFGLWYKFNEKAFIPYIGYQYENYALGLNYTVISNKISNYSPRTFEISLIITDKNYQKFVNTCKF